MELQCIYFRFTPSTKEGYGLSISLKTALKWWVTYKWRDSGIRGGIRGQVNSMQCLIVEFTIASTRW
jgi:hypothetical protein